MPRELLPGDGANALFRLYALLLLAKGEDVGAQDVHDAWVVWMLARDPEHPAIRPFADLDPDQQAADRPFVDAIRRMAADRRASTQASRVE